MTQARRPDLDTLYCINPDGSRNAIHPADVRGRHQTRKHRLWLLLIGIYVVLPWLEIGGKPAILFDIARRHFYLFGWTFNAQDFHFAFFFLTGLGFALIVASALYGRVWCGHACPQTVFLEGVFRRIERWFEGTPAQRRQRDAAPWTVRKLLVRGGRRSAEILAALLVAHTLLSYFMPVGELLAAITSPPTAHPVAFTFVAATAVAVWFDFTWFREQLCIVICPYGRLQGALADQDTVNVAYDDRRGEPRGRHTESDRGDCIDCFRCVAVCPTGIDIRNGNQFECIGCANCIDACDEVMQKVGRAPGLIRYESLRGLETGKRRFLRPRLWLYAGLLGVGLAVFVTFAARRTPFEAELVRLPGAPYVLVDGTLRNQFYLHLVNKQPERLRFRVAGSGPPVVRFTVPVAETELDPLADQRMPIFVELPRASWPQLAGDVELVVRAGELEQRVRVPLVGPR
jgi:cytochrome c oxidase accessory protein FixG